MNIPLRIGNRDSFLVEFQLDGSNYVPADFPVVLRLTPGSDDKVH